MAATITDVARAAGVHPSTVSRAFSAPQLVNPATRERVLAAAAGLGYRPNRAARALITGRTQNIGLIVADIANPFFPPLIRAAAQRARRDDVAVFVADTDEDPHTEQDLINALATQVDGIVLASPRTGNDLIARLGQDVPLVLVNRPVNGLPAVLIDVAQGARDAVAHLAALGHRRIALVTGPRTSWAAREVRRAATATARGGGIELVELGPNPPTAAAGARRAEEVRACGATAVLAGNDLLAIGLLQALDAAGVRVPEQLSVVGVDDIAPSRFTRPRLTTVAAPTADAGAAAVDLLLGSGTAGGRVRLTLPTRLVVRESTGPVPDR